MSHKLDPSYMKSLAAADPENVCRRSLAEYDREKNVYRIRAFNEIFEVNPAGQSITNVSRLGGNVRADLELLIMYYLLNSQDVEPEGKLVGEFQLKNGAMFFRGPHAFRNDAVAEKYGRDVPGFRKKCLELGGHEVSMGDAAFAFTILPRIKAVVVLWYGDDEFDAAVKTLMDPTITRHLSLDVIFGMGLELASRLAERDLWEDRQY